MSHPYVCLSLQGESQGEKVRMPCSGKALSSTLQKHIDWLKDCQKTCSNLKDRKTELKQQISSLEERLLVCSTIITDVADPLQQDVEADVLSGSYRAQCAEHCVVCALLAKRISVLLMAASL